MCCNRTFEVQLKPSILLIDPHDLFFSVKFCHYGDKHGGNGGLIGSVVVYNHRLILALFHLPAVVEMNRVITDTLRDDELSIGGTGTECQCSHSQLFPLKQ